MSLWKKLCCLRNQHPRDSELAKKWREERFLLEKELEDYKWENLKLKRTNGALHREILAQSRELSFVRSDAAEESAELEGYRSQYEASARQHGGLLKERDHLRTVVLDLQQELRESHSQVVEELKLKEAAEKEAALYREISERFLRAARGANSGETAAYEATNGSKKLDLPVPPNIKERGRRTPTHDDGLQKVSHLQVDQDRIIGDHVSRLNTPKPDPPGVDADLYPTCVGVPPSHSRSKDMMTQNLHKILGSQLAKEAAAAAASRRGTTAVCPEGVLVAPSGISMMSGELLGVGDDDIPLGMECLDHHEVTFEPAVLKRK